MAILGRLDEEDRKRAVQALAILVLDDEPMDKPKV